jgi:acetylglutamate kinase
LDVEDPASLIREIRVDEIEGLIDSGVIGGGMIPKVRGLAEAVLGGAKSASMIDGRVPHALLSALEGDGGGTTIIT